MAVNASSSSSPPQTSIYSSSLSISNKNNNDETKTSTVIEYKKGVKNLIEIAAPAGMKKLPPEFDLLQLSANPFNCVSYSHDMIPVIDLSQPNSQFTVDAIRSACQLWGFFRIQNHGVDKALVDEMLKVAEEFFDLSWDEKAKYASEDVMNPVRYGTSLNTSKKHSLHWRDYFRHYGHPFHNSFNLWPLNPPNYRDVAKGYLEQIWELAMKIGGAISEGLGLEKGYIEKSFGEGMQILAANYYPPCPEPEKTLGLAAHSDHGAITILMQNDVNGLQVKHNEQWVAVDHVPGTFVVNIGDYLEILSNGKYKSVEHRATVNAQKTRISVAVGHGPELSSIIGPAAQLVDQTEEVQYQPIVYKDYIRLQQGSTVRGKTALQAISTTKCVKNN